MRLVVKRRELTEPGQLQALVTDHVDGIETGLAVLDSRLLLGQATIDVVAMDAQGALVLMAVGSIADEEMLLKAVEAYSWCLEYPEAIRRLYRATHISSSPPRLMFVVERMPDSFHRKIKQLGFPEVDCVEFRYLDVDGTPAVFFDTLARLRRGPVAASPAPERVVAPIAPVTNGRPTSLKLQKLLGADRPGLVREPAQVVSLVHRTAPRPETPRLVVSAPKLESVAAPRLVSERAVALPASTPETPAAAVMAAVEIVPEPIDVSELEPVVPVSATVEPVDELTVAPESRSVTIDAAVEPLTTLEPSFERIAVDVAQVATMEPGVVAPDLDVRELEPVIETVATPEPIVADAVTTEPFATGEPEGLVLATEPELSIRNVPDPEPVLTLETTSDGEPLVAGDLAEPVVLALVEPAAAHITAPMIQAVEPVASPTPAPSVFARRAAEPVAKPADPKVSFADAAKELLSVTNPTPRSEPAVTIQRPSVEETTRGALDNLVGATEKPATAAEDRVTAFAKPGGVFAKPAGQKAPRTIAPPPADPQPIAAGPKLGAAPKRITPPAPAANPETAPATGAEPEAAQPAPPQGFEGLQFPNDGVLTRQWMEFLNQMAAGK